MAAGDEKPTFRCLDVARCAVAATVTGFILVVIVYAVIVVLRPGDLSLKVVGGYVSVDRNTSNQAEVKFTFTLRASNPSGRVRIYYTSIIVAFSGQISGSATAKHFVRFQIPDIGLAQQSYTDSIVSIPHPKMAPAYTNWFFKGNITSDATLILNGTRTVENYSGHNMTSEPGTIYYCPSITIGGDNPEDTAADMQMCSEHLPASASV